MKVNRLDAHDRFLHFTSQSFEIAECLQDLIEKRTFGDRPFYVFAHARTDEDGVTKRLIWQPRLTKPEAQTNSMLFKVYPGKDIVKVIWMIPAPEMWKQYGHEKMCANKIVFDSIQAFMNDKASLERREEDDPQDWQVEAIYREIGKEARAKKSAMPET